MEENTDNTYDWNESLINTDISNNVKKVSSKKKIVVIRPSTLKKIQKANILAESMSKDEVTMLSSLSKRERLLALKNKPLNKTTNKKETVNDTGCKLDNFKWHCVSCPAVVFTINELRAHYKNAHNQSPNYKCNFCCKIYSRYNSFLSHVRCHSHPKSYICDRCGKTFSQKTVLISHSSVHTNDRPHVCKHCGKTFKQFSSLYCHSKNHLPDQDKYKFPCSQCDKQFATKHTLQSHSKIHSGLRDYVCDVCGKSFIAKGSLNYHILTHNSEKQHLCPTCGKGFKTARLLDKHVTLHTGIKPYNCETCNKQFREKGALREHRRIHTGAMPYTCQFCGKAFRFKGILTVHKRQHTGERPYSCTECRKAFTNWANYNKHMKRRHKNEYTPTNVSGRNKYKPPFQLIEPDSQKPEETGGMETLPDYCTGRLETSLGDGINTGGEETLYSYELETQTSVRCSLDDCNDKKSIYSGDSICDFKMESIDIEEREVHGVKNDLFKNSNIVDDYNEAMDMSMTRHTADTDVYNSQQLANSLVQEQLSLDMNSAAISLVTNHLAAVSNLFPLTTDNTSSSLCLSNTDLMLDKNSWLSKIHTNTKLLSLFQQNVPEDDLLHNFPNYLSPDQSDSELGLSPYRRSQGNCT